MSWNETLTLDGLIDPLKLHQASMYIWRIGVPLTLLLGTFGNLMILVIQSKLTDVKGSSLSVFFTCLAVSDLTTLWCDPIIWFFQTFNYFVDFDGLYKTRVFVAYTCAHASAAILVVMTLQRAASILWPLQIGVYCTRKFAQAVMVALFTFFILLNSHLLFGHTLQNKTGNGTSETFLSYISEEYEEFFTTVYGWIDMIFCSILPFSLLLIANSVLIRKVSSSLRQTQQKLTAGNCSQLQTRQKKSSSITVTLIAVSITFIFLTLPLSLYMTYMKLFSQGASSDSSIAAANELTLAVTYFFYLCNKSVNFYIYCLTGKKYRTEFAKLFCKEHEKILEQTMSSRVPFSYSEK